MKRHEKRKIMTIIHICITLFLLGYNQEVIAEEDFLIVRVVAADYPVDSRVDSDFSSFELSVSLEIENPFPSSVRVDYECAPCPFPYMEINLVNEELNWTPLLIIEGASGVTYIPTGITEEDALVAFKISGYRNTQLPLGEYRFWWNYTACCTVSVPVICQAIIIKVSEVNISYTYEYNNQTDIVTTFENTTNPSSTETTAGFRIEVLVLLIPLLTIIKCLNHKKRKEKGKFQ